MIIEINEEPLFLARARLSKHHFYDPHYMAKKNLASVVKEKFNLPPLESINSVTFTFFLKIPGSWSRKKKDRMVGMPHTAPKDLDNAIKFFFDALNGIVWVDDRIIHTVTASKMWDYEGKTIIELDF